MTINFPCNHHVNYYPPVVYLLCKALSTCSAITVRTTKILPKNHFTEACWVDQDGLDT